MIINIYSLFLLLLGRASAFLRILLLVVFGVFGLVVVVRLFVLCLFARLCIGLAV